MRKFVALAYTCFLATTVVTLETRLSEPALGRFQYRRKYWLRGGDSLNAGGHDRHLSPHKVAWCVGKKSPLSLFGFFGPSLSTELRTRRIQPCETRIDMYYVGDVSVNLALIGTRCDTDMIRRHTSTILSISLRSE
jgi:hypothetical protein